MYIYNIYSVSPKTLYCEDLLLQNFRQREGELCAETH